MTKAKMTRKEAEAKGWKISFRMFSKGSNKTLSGHTKARKLWSADNEGLRVSEEYNLKEVLREITILEA